MRNNGYQIIGPISKALAAFKSVENNEKNDKSIIIDKSSHNVDPLTNDKIQIKLGNLDIRININRN